MSSTLNAISKVGLGKKSWKIPNTEYAHHGEIQCQNEMDPQQELKKTSAWRNPAPYSQQESSPSSAWRNMMRSSEQEGVETDALWREVCQGTKLGRTNVTKEEYTEGM